MKKLFTSVIFLFFTCLMQAQNVGIGTTSPNASALLDVQSTNKGILVPRLSSIQRNAVLAPAKGLLVFDNDTNSFWYFNGTVWQNMASISIANTWSILGNAGTNGTNFIGTTDAQPLRFGVNGGSAGIVDSTLRNVALGLGALRNNTVGYQNTAIGSKSLYSNTEGFWNNAMGNESLYANTTGFSNTAMGEEALRANTTGSYNTAMGSGALIFNTTGSNNTANGESALFSNRIGNNNTAVGYYALYANTIGRNNTANGTNALFSNTIGINNNATGVNALADNTTGNRNAAYANKALSNNKEGSGNVAMGDSAMYINVSGNENTAIGMNALTNNLNGSNNVAIGSNGGLNSTSSNNTFVGSSAGQAANNGNNTCIGVRAYSTALNVVNYTGVGYNVGDNLSLSNYVELGNTSVTTIRAQVTGITAFSDKRIKENIDYNVPGLAFVNQLKPVTYTLNIHKQNALLSDKAKPDTAYWEGKYDIEKMTQTGFLAQDVEDAMQKLGIQFSGLVRPQNDRDLYTLRYTDFIMPLVKAVQEQQVQIENLKKQNELLFKRLEKLAQK